MEYGFQKPLKCASSRMCKIASHTIGCPTPLGAILAAGSLEDRLLTSLLTCLRHRFARPQVTANLVVERWDKSYG